MLDVTLITPLGDEYRLTGTDRDSTVLAPYGALQELRANVTRDDQPDPFGTGVTPGSRTFGAIQTEIEFLLKAPRGETLEHTYSRFRQGWVSATQDHPCVFRIESDNPLSPLTFEAVVDGALPGTQVDMSRRTSETVRVPLVCFQGVAQSSLMSNQGTTEVYNPGDVPIWVTLRYSGKGGQVTAPSGAKFTLPPAEDGAEQVVNMDSRKLRLEGAFPESIPPGESGTWKVPAEVQVQWRVGVADPWG